MRSEIVLNHFHSFFLREVFGRLIREFGVCIVVDVVVERTVMIVGNLSDGFVEDDIGLIVNAHDFSLKDAVVLGDYSSSFAYILVLEDLLSISVVHI